MTILISSAANPVVKRMRLLGDRKHRWHEGAFVVEGIQPVWQAVEAGADVEVLVVARTCWTDRRPRGWSPGRRPPGSGWPG
jgi:hypothetical protein